MHSSRAVHVDEDAIIAYMGGGLEAPAVSAFRQHLDGCPDCLALVACVVKQRDPATLSTLPIGTGAIGTDPHPAASPPILEPGAQIGPYEIERVLGAGGMGVVYVARDPRLDRKVALKLIRQGHAEHRDELVERLRRESKALARLSHPNVTVVYELGAGAHEIYVAMEYVAGTNLRAWLAETRRDPEAIIATFAQAGRGLAAVHAAGLVHRDFKPDNVLLGDGAIKVTDFGLARLADDARPLASIADDELVEAVLTRTGGLIGTPPYMAPEQFRGGVADARSDQYAFCVALYEAIYGERPFGGRTVTELREAVLAGRVQLARTTRVPRRVRRALARGLATDPRARFADMDALLAALAPRRTRVALAIGAGAITLAALAMTLVLRGPAPETCAGATAEIQEVWNVGRRIAIEHAFLATHAATTGRTWAEVERGIDAYTTGWTAMHRGTCEATRVHRAQSEAILDLRMACLERRRSQLDALLSVFTHADAGVVAHAEDAVVALGDLRPCADVEALTRRAPPPSDPVARRHYDALRARLDAVRASFEVARYTLAEHDVAAILAEPRTSAFPAIEAEAQFLRGKVTAELGDHEHAEQALFRALTVAQAARSDEVVLDAAVDLAFVVGYRAQRTADGLRWVDFAEAALKGKGGDDLLAARLDTIHAEILERAGRLSEAETFERAALALAKHHAPGDRLEAEVLDALGSNLGQQGKLDDAIPMLQTALAIRERVFGAVHALTTSTRMNLANALGTTHRYDEALVQFRRALAADEAMFGPDGVENSAVLGNMGQMLQERGDARAARPLLERALAIRERALGANDPAVARAYANLGYVLIDDHAYDDALARFARADAIIEHALGAEHPARSDVLEGTGLAWIGRGEPAKAIEPLEHALRIREQNPGDPVELAGSRAALGRALWASGRDRARAAKLAGAARAVLVGAGEDRAVAELDGWLGAR